MAHKIVGGKQQHAACTELVLKRVKPHESVIRSVTKPFRPEHTNVPYFSGQFLILRCLSSDIHRKANCSYQYSMTEKPDTKNLSPGLNRLQDHVILRLGQPGIQQHLAGR
ncbi:jg27846 [Pararge aegeria aegeria]|uniref:Jg27846 protein n=1 Tax=Pararge aegeria aegeria TaxID=348720 RepID=A0A8S4QN35_9NEOP|nr:jg27846 [Pararge aegeria aegeria]